MIDNNKIFFWAQASEQRRSWRIYIKKKGTQSEEKKTTQQRDTTKVHFKPKKIMMMIKSMTIISIPLFFPLKIIQRCFCSFFFSLSFSPFLPPRIVKSHLCIYERIVASPHPDIYTCTFSLFLVFLPWCVDTKILVNKKKRRRTRIQNKKKNISINIIKSRVKSHYIL